MTQPTNRRLVTEAAAAADFAPIGTVADLAALALLVGAGGGPTPPPVLPPPVVPLPVLAAPTRTKTLTNRTGFLTATAVGELAWGDKLILSGTAAAPVQYGSTSADTVITTPSLTGFTVDNPPPGIWIVAQETGGALIDRGTTYTSGYALFGNAMNYVQVEGLKIRGGQKAVMLHRSSYNRFVNCEALSCGMELVHFRIFSSFNQWIGGSIHGSGLDTSQSGKCEGIYFGQAESTWGSVYAGDTAGGVPDTSDGNQVIGAAFYAIDSEVVDIKEGTTGGVVRGCTMDGASISGNNDANSFVDCKGNDYLIEDNSCSNPSVNVIHAMETHINFAGYGNRNVFKNNTLTAGGKTGGQPNSATGSQGINILKSGSRGSATGNVVYDDNTASAAPGGLSNIPTTPAAAAPGGGAVDDATTVTKGIVRLAGDLAGSADAPTVPGLAGKAPLASPTFTGTVQGVTKGHVGLGNAENTADADKPVSLLQQAALDDLAVDVADRATNGALTGHVTSGLHYGHVAWAVEDAVAGWPALRPNAGLVIWVALGEASPDPTAWQYPDILFKTATTAPPPVTYLTRFTTEGYAAAATIVAGLVNGSGTAPDSVNAPAGTSITAVSSPVLSGTRAARFAINSGTAATTVFAQWNASVGTRAAVTFGCQVLLPVAPTANTIVLRARDVAAAAPTRVALRVTPSMTVQLLDAASTAIDTTSTLTVTAGEKFWAELQYDGVGQFLRARITKADGVTEEVLGDLATVRNVGIVGARVCDTYEVGVLTSLAGPVEVVADEVRSLDGVGAWVRS